MVVPERKQDREINQLTTQLGFPKQKHSKSNGKKKVKVKLSYPKCPL